MELRFPSGVARLILDHIDSDELAAICVFVSDLGIQRGTKQLAANYATRMGWLSVMRNFESKEIDQNGLLYHAVASESQEMEELVLSRGATYKEAIDARVAEDVKVQEEL